MKTTDNACLLLVDWQIVASSFTWSTVRAGNDRRFPDEVVCFIGATSILPRKNHE